MTTILACSSRRRILDRRDSHWFLGKFVEVLKDPDAVCPRSEPDYYPRHFTILWFPAALGGIPDVLAMQRYFNPLSWWSLDSKRLDGAEPDRYVRQPVGVKTARVALRARFLRCVTVGPRMQLRWSAARRRLPKGSPVHGIVCLADNSPLFQEKLKVDQLDQLLDNELSLFNSWSNGDVRCYSIYSRANSFAFCDDGDEITPSPVMSLCDIYESHGETERLADQAVCDLVLPLDQPPVRVCGESIREAAYLFREEFKDGIIPQEADPRNRGSVVPGKRRSRRRDTPASRCRDLR